MLHAKNHEVFKIKLYIDFSLTSNKKKKNYPIQQMK